MIELLTGSHLSEFYPPPADRRADTLAIKETIAQLMTDADGLDYWNSLAKFLKGKLDRNEFESNTTHLLNSEKLVGLHNALILSILYNSTRSEPPPNQGTDNKSNYHTAGHGWYKRKRTSPPQTKTAATTRVNPNSNDSMLAQKNTTNEDERDPKRAKIKQAVFALGQRERNRIKEISSTNLITSNIQKDSQSAVDNSPQVLHQPEQLKVSKNLKFLAHQRTLNVLNTPLASKMKISSSSLYQEYMRCQGAPVCSESRQLPDFNTLKDRMSLIAYDSGLINGVEKSASSLALIGLEVHLKTLLGDLLSLIRADRSVSSNPVDQAESNNADPDTRPEATDDPSASNQPTSDAIIVDVDPSSSAPIKPTPVTLLNQASSNLRLRDLKTQGLAPHLTAWDVAALAEISPHAFVRTHPAALDRLIATCSSSHSSPALPGPGATVNASDQFDRKPAASSIPRVWPKPVAIEPRFGNA